MDLQAPVTAVTVYEDRAAVTRQATLALEAGVHRLTLRNISPLAVESSLNARCKLATLTIIDLKLSREVVRRFPHVDVQALVGEKESLQQRLETLSQQESRLQLRLSLRIRWIDDAKRRSRVTVPRGLSPRPLFGQLDALWDSLKADQQEVQGLQREKELLQEALERVNTALTAAGRPTEERFQARLDVVVETTEANTFPLELQYMTPCALWRPEHDARLEGPVQGSRGESVAQGSSHAGVAAGASGSTSLGRVRFCSQAVIWQATGEDWSNVQLSCSTARPGRVSSPPLLTDDVLVARRKVDVKTVVAEVREEQIQTVGQGSAVVASDMPGVDDGGEAQSWTVPQPVTVLSDGKPVRAPLSAFECPALGGFVCMPERLPQALLRAELSNAGTRPVLAGPVVLYRDGGYVGRSRIGYVAPGEKFRLSFGSLNGVRVHRTQAVKREETRITGYQTYTISVSLALSNQSDETVKLELVERIPVSELEEVKVSLLDRTAGKADPDGLVSLWLTLPPRGTQTQELGFKVEAPSRVVLPY